MINIRKTPTRHGNIYGVAQNKGRTFKFCTCMHLTGPFTEHIEIFLTPEGADNYRRRKGYMPAIYLVPVEGGLVYEPDSNPDWARPLQKTVAEFANQHRPAA